MAALVTVDARMLRSSGIGTYLRALLPRLVERLPEARFCLLGNVEELRREKVASEPRVELRALAAGVYSPMEQVLIPRVAPPETRVFWSPHVNVPVRSPGLLLVTVHDAFYLAPPAGVRVRLDKRLYLGALMRVIRSRAAAVLCGSDFTRNELERASGPWPCPLHVVPYGVERRFFEPLPAGAPPERPYLLFVGNLKEHKNLRRTLAAFARVAGRVQHDFVLVGGGDADALRAELDSAVAPRVRFHGVVGEAKLRELVARASGLVLASLYEGFGLPPLEAMAQGVPVLVSRAASLPEVCGDAALYCDPLSVEDIARGIETLLCDVPTRERLAREGPVRARALDWDQAGERTAAVVARLLAT